MIPTCCTSSPRGVTSPLLVRSHDRFGMRDKLPQSDALRGDLVIRDTASSFGICRCTAGLLPGPEGVGGGERQGQGHPGFFSRAIWPRFPSPGYVTPGENHALLSPTPFPF